MKHLKTSSQDLRELFESSITVKSIAESLVSFDSDRSAAQVRLFMKEKDYDIVGVRENGLAVGFVHRDDLSSGKLREHLKRFDTNSLFSEATPLIKIFETLRDLPRIFVLNLGRVGGIVTRGDLQKAPIRMWLFGVISLIEMQMLRIIREYYPGDSWRSIVTVDRLRMAETLLADRIQRNEAIDLADCLQFADKRNIILKHDKLWSLIGFESKTKGKDLLENLERLRNELAHAQDISTGNWPDVVDLAIEAQSVLRNCELVSLTGVSLGNNKQ